MNINNLINMAFMQALWFVAVLGAAENVFWWTPLLLVFFMGWELISSQQINSDIKLMGVAVLFGLVLDSTWINLGWLEFSGSWPNVDKAPLWILILWSGLALTLNHSLAWLQNRLLLAALLGGLSSPLSYMAAARFGAVKITDDSWQWFVGLGLSWAIALPVLLWLARQLNHLQQKEGDYV